MFPLGDDLAKGWRYPGVLSLMTLLTLSALIQWAYGDQSVEFFGFHPEGFSRQPWVYVAQLFTSVFLHANVWHLLGNLLFLWVFARALEDLFRCRILLGSFPLLGMTGNLAHWIAYPDSIQPVIGASGAIAALMGAYVALFPHARVRILLWVGIPLGVWTPRAWLLLSFWIAIQMISIFFGTEEVDGVAYLVHTGGFIVGLLSAIVWKVQSVGGEERLEQYLRTRSGSAWRQP